MATYTYNTWETINLPVVSGDTYFRILRNSSTTPGEATVGVVFDGLILDGQRLTNLNEILSPYVKTETLYFPTGTNISSLTQDDEQFSHFLIYYTQNNWQTYTYDSIYVKYNWTYESTLPQIRSYRPINLLDYRQYFILTMQAPPGGTSDDVYVRIQNNHQDSFTIEDTSLWTYMLDLRQSIYAGAFSYDYSYDYDVDRTFMQPGSYNELGIYDDYRTFAFKYYITHTCYNYALYYRNDMGGWDYMLFGGRELQKDDITRLQYKKSYNAGAFDWGKVNYLTNINEKWELNTTFLNDSQSENLQPLFHSNYMFLQDLNDSKLIPVNITNTSAEHKTFKNQGRKLYTYKITLESAQDKFSI